MYKKCKSTAWVLKVCIHPLFRNHCSMVLLDTRNIDFVRTADKHFLRFLFSVSLMGLSMFPFCVLIMMN